MGGLRKVAGGSGRLENTHRVTIHSLTHTDKQTHAAAMFTFIKMHAFSHPIYLNLDFLCKGHRKRRRVVFLPHSKLARSNCAQYYVVKNRRFLMQTLIALIAIAFYMQSTRVKVELTKLISKTYHVKSEGRLFLAFLVHNVSIERYQFCKTHQT